MTAAEPLAETGAVSRHIGGERAHRGFFGGTQPRGRILGLGVAFLVLLVATPIAGLWGVVAAVALAGIALALTQRTHRGSVLERRLRRHRWTTRLRAGTDRYEPYDDTEWEARQAAFRAAPRRDRAAAAKRLVAMRAMPDGADGMGLLQLTPGEPGIAWHAPVGEEAYLSVAFEVSGQAAGVESGSAMRRAAEAWGLFLASRAAPTSLAGTVQTLTRVLPADSALQEFWVLSALDETAPPEAIASYDEVLRATGRGAMVQRHFLTVRWPITPAFLEAAARYGHGRDGWRALMRQEIAATRAALADARLGRVEALTARRAAAVILHQQNPARPIDFVADVTPTRLGVASRDEFSAHVVTGSDPVTGRAVEWWHRTAAIHSEDLAQGPRSQLWLLDLLSGAELDTIRSVAFHLRLIPKGQAKAAARSDLVRDRADARAASEKGRLVSDETVSNLTAAQQRAEDLSHGSPHHGAEWAGFVTLSARSRDELRRACRNLEDVCATGLGIQRLDWLDSAQAAASGTTWPIARGLAPTKASFATRMLDRLAGTGGKESLT